MHSTLELIIYVDLRPYDDWLHGLRASKRMVDDVLDGSLFLALLQEHARLMLDTEPLVLFVEVASCSQFFHPLLNLVVLSEIYGCFLEVIDGLVFRLERISLRV
jgi:hypothetical protein